MDVKKLLIGAGIVILFLVGFSMCKSCGAEKEQAKNRKAIDTLNKQISVKFYTKEEIDKKFDNLQIAVQIEGYEISKRMLYDNNAIVRTTMRPDDQMNAYDQKIKELRDKLK